MPALMSAHHKTRIHHLGMSAVYRIAADEGCDPSDVISLLVTTSMTSISGDHSPFVRLPVTTPSQPVSPPVPAVQAGEEVNSSSLGSSPVEPISSSAPNGDETAHGRDSLSHAAPTSPPGAESAEDRAIDADGPEKVGASRHRLTDGERADIVRKCHAQHPDWPASKIADATGLWRKSIRGLVKGLPIPSEKQYRDAQQSRVKAELKAAPAGKKRGGGLPKRDHEILDLRKAKPDLNAKQIAERTGMSVQHVFKVAAKAEMPFRTKGLSLRQRVIALYAEHPDWDSHQMATHLGARQNSVYQSLRDAKELAGTFETPPPPAPTPQTPVAPPPPPTSGTLTERVRVMHQQRPNWTARMIALELGAKIESVSVLLAGVRGEAKKAATVDQQPFTGIDGARAHYGEIAKRLGKA